MKVTATCNNKKKTPKEQSVLVFFFLVFGSGLGFFWICFAADRSPSSSPPFQVASSEEQRPRRERRCWGCSVLERAPLLGLWVTAELIKEEDAAERGASVLMGPAGWRRRGCLGFFMAEEGEGKTGREGERGVMSGGCDEMGDDSE